jgi:hypothetical protein
MPNKAFKAKSFSKQLPSTLTSRAIISWTLQPSGITLHIYSPLLNWYISINIPTQH